MKAAPSTNGHVADDLNLDELRLPQNFADAVGVQKVLVRVPVRRPDRQWFVRVHPDANYSMEAGLLELREDREFYLLKPSAWPGAGMEMQPCVIHTAVTRGGAIFLWPVRLPGRDGKDNLWHASARDAAQLAKRAWVSVRANSDPGVGGYEVFEATANIPEPVWPAMSFAHLLQLAFKDRIIDDPTHDVLLRLMGTR